MMSGKNHDNEDENNLDTIASSTGLLRENHPDSQTPDIPFCGCLR